MIDRPLIDILLSKLK